MQLKIDSEDCFIQLWLKDQNLVSPFGDLEAQDTGCILKKVGSTWICQLWKPSSSTFAITVTNLELCVMMMNFITPIRDGFKLTNLSVDLCNKCGFDRCISVWSWFVFFPVLFKHGLRLLCFLVFLQGRVYILNIEDMKSSLNTMEVNEWPLVLYKQKHSGHETILNLISKGNQQLASHSWLNVF